MVYTSFPIKLLNKFMRLKIRNSKILYIFLKKLNMILINQVFLEIRKVNYKKYKNY